MEYKLLTNNLSKDQNLTLIEQVFANRGIKPNQIKSYLHTTEKDILNPELLDNIKEGTIILLKHLVAGDKIFIQIDPDVDGYTASAMLINYLNKIAPGHTQQNIIYRIHDGKQHGLLLDTIPANVKLVIAPDSSSNDFEIHASLKEKGIDVLVLDHHEAEKYSENACVINNQLSKNYFNKDLSGVGVVYKFCQYIDKIGGFNYANNFLDLVAVGLEIILA